MLLDSELSSVQMVEEMTEKLALQAGFEEDDASQLAMVAREAAVNAVLHGNKYDPQKKVCATFELTSEELRIQISDEGGGMDPEAIPDPLAPENIMRSSGRGVFLMRAIMDEVHFRQLTPGTEITMVKRRLKKETEA